MNVYDVMNLMFYDDATRVLPPPAALRASLVQLLMRALTDL